MHIPSYATTDAEKYNNFILGIQGLPGTGKTVSTMTFPNPIYALFERPDFEGILQLPQFKGRELPPILPFYDEKFVTKTLEQPLSGKLADPANAFKRFLDSEDCMKFTAEQTLVLDNWTRLQDFWDEVNWSLPLYPTYTRKNEIDDFAPWERKIDFSTHICKRIAKLNCNVVFLFHESQDRDPQTGRLLDKVQPLMQGKFTAKLKGYFPNFYRAVRRLKKDKDGKTMVPETQEFMWRITSNDDFEAKNSNGSLVGPLIPADYASLNRPPFQQLPAAACAVAGVSTTNNPTK